MAAPTDAGARGGDLYAALGVPRDADTDTIRKAYRRLARETHPDLNPGDAAAEERFKQISRAWEVLQDDEKRRNYDEFGEISLEAGFDADEARRAREAFGARFGYAGAPGAAGGGEHFEFADIDDLLGRMFGGRGRGEATGFGGPFGADAGGLRMRGSPVRATLELDFLEAVRGGEKRLTLGRPTPSGEVAPETITVRIPPGVADGGELRIPGKGAPGIGGGPPGDLLLSLRVRPHPVFAREGRNLVFDLPIHVREAVAGAEVEVPTLDGRATLVIPPGTSSGQRLRLRGKGMPSPGGGAPGDMLVRIEIRVPRGLDADAVAALEALEPFEDPGIRKELLQ